MSNYRFSVVVALLAGLVGLASAQSNANCEAFGINVANGGTYYFNLASQAPFSFSSGFTNCFGTATPILQDPAGTQFICSTISVTLSNAESVCPLSHGQLVSGAYIIFFPEIGFVRGFTVTNTQTTITISQTLTATATITPVVTSTHTITSTFSSTVTLSPSTIILPAATKGTVTFSPQETVTSSITRTRTTHVQTTVSTTSTITKTAPCTKSTSVKDNPHTPTKIPRMMRHIRRDDRVRERDLVKRDGPDGFPTTTTTVFGSAVATIVTAAVSTTSTTLTVDTVTISTITPLPFTTFSGTVVSSVTLSTKIITSTTRSTTTSTVIQTRTANFKAIVTAAPIPC